MLGGDNAVVIALACRKLPPAQRGATLLGWIAGGMMLTDPAMPAGVARSVPYASNVFAASGAALVVIFGELIGHRRLVQPAHEVSATADGN